MTNKIASWIKLQLRLRRGLHETQLPIWNRQNPFLGTPLATSFTGEGDLVLGIAEDWAQGHVDYLRACQELKVSYRVIDIMADSWLQDLTDAAVDGLLVRPMTYTALWKQAFDERLTMVARQFALPICPSPLECWLYESKRRIRDWLVMHGIDAPKTSVHFREDHAMEELRHAVFPLVAKTDTGAAAAGVWILQNRAQGEKLVRKVFRSGVRVSRSVPQDRQWGCILFQEYLPNCREWRMVRIGDSCFCREKLRGADGLHSGSGSVQWAEPTPVLLERLWSITEQGGFTSLNVDFFESEDKRLLVNEFHAYFGGIRPQNVDKGGDWKGRWLRSDAGSWNFEPGYFYQNACANLRVEMMLAAINAGR